MGRNLSFLITLVLVGVLSGCGSKNISDNSPFAQNITVRLDGATEYGPVEIFGKVLKTAPGVVAAKNYSQRIVADDPAQCRVLWRAQVDETTDGFTLQTAIMSMLDDVIYGQGKLNLNGVEYNYSSYDIAFLRGIRPADATSLAIEFILDRELVRDSEMRVE